MVFLHCFKLMPSYQLNGHLYIMKLTDVLYDDNGKQGVQRNCVASMRWTTVSIPIFINQRPSPIPPVMFKLKKSIPPIMFKHEKPIPPVMFKLKKNILTHTTCHVQTLKIDTAYPEKNKIETLYLVTPCIYKASGSNQADQILIYSKNQLSPSMEDAFGQRETALGRGFSES